MRHSIKLHNLALTVSATLSVAITAILADSSSPKAKKSSFGNRRLTSRLLGHIMKAETSCTIRRAQADEAGALSELAFQSKAYWGYSSAFMAACRAELTYSPTAIDLHYFYVAEKRQSIVGFYALGALSSVEVELDALFVDPAYIRQGYGRTLIEHAIVTASGLGFSVMIIHSDPNAKAFYLSAGGELTGEGESASIPGRYLPILEIKLKPANETT